MVCFNHALNPLCEHISRHPLACFLYYALLCCVYPYVSDGSCSPCVPCSTWHAACGLKCYTHASTHASHKLVCACCLLQTTHHVFDRSWPSSLSLSHSSARQVLPPESRVPASKKSESLQVFSTSSFERCPITPTHVSYSERRDSSKGVVHLFIFTCDRSRERLDQPAKRFVSRWCDHHVFCPWRMGHVGCRVVFGYCTTEI